MGKFNVCRVIVLNMKQVILIREDIDMSVGKTVAQGSHVSVIASRQADEDTVEEWIEEGGKKIVLRVPSKQELESIVNQASELPTAKIEDLGYTELDAGTLTAGAIGPASENRIDEFTSHLQLYQ